MYLCIKFGVQIWADRAERHDLKLKLWLLFSYFLFPPKKEGIRKEEWIAKIEILSHAFQLNPIVALVFTRWKFSDWSLNLIYVNIYLELKLLRYIFTVQGIFELKKKKLFFFVFKPHHLFFNLGYRFTCISELFFIKDT